MGYPTTTTRYKINFSFVFMVTRALQCWGVSGRDRLNIKFLNIEGRPVRGRPTRHEIITKVKLISSRSDRLKSIRHPHPAGPHVAMAVPNPVATLNGCRGPRVAMTAQHNT